MKNNNSEQWQPKLKHIDNMFTYTNNTPKLQVHIINMVKIIPMPSLLVHISHVPISCFVHMHVTYSINCNVLSDITSFFVPTHGGFTLSSTKVLFSSIKIKDIFPLHAFG
jgi:hypothetical protein